MKIPWKLVIQKESFRFSTNYVTCFLLLYNSEKKVVSVVHTIALKSFSSSSYPLEFNNKILEMYFPSRILFYKINKSLCLLS